MAYRVINGRAIEHYKDFDVRETGLAELAEPKYKASILNGLAPFDFPLNGLVLYLPLWALKGSSFKSVDANKMIATVIGATWTPNGRDFNAATLDYIEIPASYTQLNFTSEDFSIIARVRFDTISSYVSIFMRGLWDKDGYWFVIDTNGALQIITFQTPGDQLSDSDNGDIVTNTWYTVGCSRSGASGQVFINGVDSTTTSGTHVNPLTSARSAKIGIYDSKVAYPFDGKIESLMVYNRALSAGEHLHTHNVLSWRE